ncbi:hypothetical protein [Vibrio mediterranei]|uniref:hypothetical protein n=1 Tax=Vibrio mediterranei TaxID=689 RepID=UPI004067B7E2
MIVSNFHEAVYYVIEATNDLDLRKVSLSVNGKHQSAIYSDKHGGIIGTHGGPDLFGAATQDLIESGYVEGARLSVYPCWLMDGEVYKLGFKPGYTIREYDEPCVQHGFLVFNIHSRQVMAVGRTLNDSATKVNAGWDLQATYQMFETLFADESVIGRSLVDLTDQQCFQVEKDGIVYQRPDHSAEAAAAWLNDKYFIGVKEEDLCVI